MTDNNPTSTPKDESPEKSGVEARRSFLKKTLASGPIIASFSARPTWATGGNDDCIQSGTLSGNMSNHSCQAIGRSPGWWWNNNGLQQWYKTGVDSSTRFSEFLLDFGAQTGWSPRPKGGTAIPDRALLDLGPRNSNSVDMHVIAAVLNFLHPGIMYSGNNGVFGSAEQVIAAYDAARANNDNGALRSIKNELDSYDPDGHDIYF